MKKVFKGILSFLLAIVWFLFTFAGILILAIPQITMTIYGSKTKPLDIFVDTMEELLAALEL